MNENRRSRRSNARPHGGRLVGLATAAGAFLALGMTPLAAAPAARADIDDLFIQPIVEAIGQGLDVDSVAAPALAATDSADPTNLLSTSDPFASLDSQFGDGGTTTTAGAAAEVASTAVVPEGAAVELHINAITEPVVNLSISGGWDIPVVVDTGSAGLIVPWYDLGLQGLGFPTSLGIGAFSGGLDYLYVTLPATVDFGNGIVTGQTGVDAVLFTWPTTFPTSLQALVSGSSLPGFLGPAHAEGVLGIGPNAVGPGPSVPTTALPDGLNQGVLIDEAKGQLVFGPNPLGADAISVDGAPNASLLVQINDGPLQHVKAIIDSGGVYGTMPQSIIGADQANGMVAPGTTISVYTTGHDLLYSYMTTAANGPIVTSGTTMNTGYMPFAQHPVYISTSGNGATIFGAAY
jgi:hypothetical protein